MASFGLFKRKEVWVPTWRLLAVLAFFTGLGGWMLCFRLHPFLAVTERLQSETLVVEGWLPGYAMEAVVMEFRTGNYRRVFTVGGAMEHVPVGWPAGSTYAEACAETLKTAGIPKEVITSVPQRTAQRARTWASAKALKGFLKDRPSEIANFNLVTMDVHARRSRMLFQEAFGESVKVGVVSIPSRDYDVQKWWVSSEGFKSNLGEAWTLLFYRLTMLLE